MSDNRAQSIENSLRTELKLIAAEKAGSWKEPIVQPCIWRQALPEPQRKSLEDMYVQPYLNKLHGVNMP
jgi:hypothetical protein